MSTATAATRFTRIAVAFDDSAGARAALARAVALTQALPDARLTVIAIDEPPEHMNAFAPAASGGPRRIELSSQSGEEDSNGSGAGATSASTSTSTSTRARTVRHAEDWLRTAADYAQRQGVPVATELRIGHPAGQILIAARAARADLLVIGHSRHPELHNRVLGSTAEHVARHAYCSVLIAH